MKIIEFRNPKKEELFNLLDKQDKDIDSYMNLVKEKQEKLDRGETLTEEEIEEVLTAMAGLEENSRDIEEELKANNIPTPLECIGKTKNEMMHEGYRDYLKKEHNMEIIK